MDGMTLRPQSIIENGMASMMAILAKCAEKVSTTTISRQFTMPSRVIEPGLGNG